MAGTSLESLRIKAKLLQKAKKKAGKEIQLKEAFDIIAKASGFKSWQDLSELYVATEHYCPKGSSAHWKVWFKNYDEALKHLADGADYLLPYRDHYFICEKDYLTFLGIDPNDEDLKKIGRNWIEPKDADAFLRLTTKLQAKATA